MVAASASISATEIIQKYLLGFEPYWSIFAYSRLGAILAMLPIAYLYRDEFSSMVRNRQFKALGIISISQTLNILAILSILYASSTGYVTLVNAVTQVQPFLVLLFTVLLSNFMPHVLRERQEFKLFFRKFASIALMIIGVMLLMK